MKFLSRPVVGKKGGHDRGVLDRRSH